MMRHGLKHGQKISEAMKKPSIIFVAVFGAIFFATWYWLFDGWYVLSMIGNDAKAREFENNSIECLYPWRKLRILQHVLRPGTQPEDGQIYTAIYYEQDIPGGEYSKYIALYHTKAPRFETCTEKFASRYGSPNRLDPNNPPIAMTIYEGDFVLQTTDDPKGGVALEKLPLLFGPLEPKVTGKHKTSPHR